MLTEQDIRENENYRMQWHNEFDNKCNEYIREINVLLKEKTLENKNKLKSLFTNLSQGEYVKYEEIAYMSIIMYIYDLEDQNKVEISILDHGDMVKDLINYYLKLKFQIWRLEFSNNTFTDTEFIKYVNSSKASEYAISSAIIYSSDNIINMIIKASKILINDNNYNFAYNILRHGTSLYPDNNEILYTIYNLCMSLDQIDIADYYLERIRCINSKEGVK